MKTINFTEVKDGAVLSEVWGYSMTIVEYYKITGVSASGKTFMAKELKQKGVGEQGFLSGQTIPTEEFTGDFAILREGEGQGGKRWKGTFHYANGGTRKGIYASEWDGKPLYHNHAD